MRKSIKAVIIVAAGMIILGKYTLLMRLELSIRLFDDSDNEFAKRDQGSMAEKTMRA